MSPFRPETTGICRLALACSPPVRALTRSASAVTGATLDGGMTVPAMRRLADSGEALP
jgi:hypothetical protein